jgi:membrane glycosyltransferase
VFGIAFGLGAYAVSWALFLWMSPVILGLVLAIPLAAITSRRGVGQALRRIGLLLIPEETAPPPVLARTRTLQMEFTAATMPASVRDLLADPGLVEAHRRMLPPPRRRRADPVDPDLLVGLLKIEEAETLDEALAALSRREIAAVLADPRGLDLLAALGSAPPPPHRQAAG